MEFFGAASPWSRSPFSPKMGQSEPSIGEGQKIPANGGHIEKAIGFLWFFFDPDVLDRIEAATGERPSESIEARVTMCNPTPGILPMLGNFQDPATGDWCFIDLPEEWNAAWRGGVIDQLDLTIADEGVPPYFGEWGAEGAGCGKVGPFDTIQEAFDAAAQAAGEHGATALPGDGWAQVKDSRGNGVGPIT